MRTLPNAQKVYVVRSPYWILGLPNAGKSLTNAATNLKQLPGKGLQIRMDPYRSVLMYDAQADLLGPYVPWGLGGGPMAPQ